MAHPQVAGLSFGGALAIEFSRRHPDVPKSLILVSAYAGWRGSLPPDAAEQRLAQARELSDLGPEPFVDALLPTMFSNRTPPETVDASRAALMAFHPAGFRAMSRASAEDVRDALPHIDVPTLLIYGDQDVRAPLTVAEGLHQAIANPSLEVMTHAGHLCNLEAPDELDAILRPFLLEHVTWLGSTRHTTGVWRALACARDRQ